MTAKRTTIHVEITETEKNHMREVLDSLMDLLEDMRDNDTMFFIETSGCYANLYFERKDIAKITDFLAYCIENPAILE